MTFTSLLIHTVTIQRRTRTGEDEQGVDVFTWGTVATTPAWVEQSEATEVREGRDAVVTDWLIFLPADIDINAHDRVVYGDLILEAIGTPAERFTRRGLHHIEARARLVEGG